MNMADFVTFTFSKQIIKNGFSRHVYFLLDQVN